jgi:hypothetical protein
MNHKSIIIFLSIYFFISMSLYSEPSKKIYLSELIAKKGVSPAITEKIASLLSMKIHSNLSNSITFIDSNFSKAYNKNINKKGDGCNTNPCDKWIEESFQPTHKLRGELELSGNKFKLIINLEKIPEMELITSREIYLPMNNFETEVGIFITSLLDSSRLIMESNSIITDKNIEFSPINLKEVITLEIFPFPDSEPTEEERNFFKKREDKILYADLLAQKKDYVNSYIQYKSVQDMKIETEISKKFPKYFELEKNFLSSRTSIVYFNSLALVIQRLDMNINNQTKFSSKSLEDLSSKYQKLYDSLLDNSISSVNELKYILLERIEILDIKNLSILEIKADTDYVDLKLNESLKEYTSLVYRLSQKLKSARYISIKNRIETKIQKIINYKKYYFLNGARTYCSLSELNYSELSKLKEKASQEEAIKREIRFKESVNLAKELFKSSDYILEEAVEKCTKTFQIVDIRVADLMAGKEKVVKLEEYPIPTAVKIDYRKFVFPGYWHIKEENDKLKSKILFYGGIASLVTTLSFAGATAQNALEYNNLEKTSPLLLLGGYNLFNYSVINDIQNEESKVSAYNQSKANLSISAAIYSAIYIYSIFDSTILTKSKTGISEILFPMEKTPGGAFQFNFKTAVVPTQSGLKRDIENKIELGYDYYF